MSLCTCVVGWFSFNSFVFLKIISLILFRRGSYILHVIKLMALCVIVTLVAFISVHFDGHC